MIYKTALALMKLKEKNILKNSLEENLPFVTDFDFYDQFSDDEFIKMVFSFEVELEEILKLEQEYTLTNKTTIKRL